jgi:hypothetical protein
MNQNLTTLNEMSSSLGMTSLTLTLSHLYNKSVTPVMITVFQFGCYLYNYRLFNFSTSDKLLLAVLCLCVNFVLTMIIDNEMSVEQYDRTKNEKLFYGNEYEFERPTAKNENDTEMANKEWDNMFSSKEWDSIV